ncbi:Site-specific DNA recombinase [Ruminococcaceae bacterium FB2012]|nr:Site-specific DNA recombinase [Ruminococcaceae bacterium FB2012]
MAQMTVIPPTKKQRREKLRVAAYCRVSTAKEDQAHSYEAQLRYFSSLYENSETEVLIGIYADEGISGTKLDKRLELNRMLDDCRHGKIDRIVTKSVSRFARNTRDCLKCIRELKELGISIAFEKENIDTAKQSDEMMITLMGGLAQEESQSISNNSRWGIHKKMAAGTFRHAKIPYGYRKDDESGGLIIDSEKAEVIKRIFSLYINGTGARKITLMLNSEGIPSPTGIRWNQKTVLKILAQEKYTGDTLWQKTYSEFMGKQFMPNEGQESKYYIVGTHEPIISKEMFAAAQAVRKKAAPKTQNRSESPFRRKLICGCCGHIYRYVSSKGKPYWQCGYRYDISEPCNNSVFSDSELQTAFEALCDKLHAHKEILEVCGRQLTELNALKTNGTVNAAEFYKAIAELREQKHRLSQLMTKGFISQEKYDEQINAINIKIDKVDCEIRFNAEIENKNSDDLSEIIEMFTEYDGSENTKRDILDTAVDNITVDNGMLSFTLIGGLEFTERIGAYGEQKDTLRVHNN